MSIAVECPVRGGLVEGPHWDAANNVLYFIDIFARKIHRWDPGCNTVDTLTVPDKSIGAAVLTDKGRLLFAAGHRFGFIDPKTGEIENVVDVESKTRPGNRFNDGKCDPVGRFWAGTMGPEPPAVPIQKATGTLYCLHRDGSVTTHADEILVSNGLAWTQSLMYYNDSPKRTIDVFDYDQTTGRTSNRRVAVDTSGEQGVPDGMCLDAEGMLWVAMYDGWKVIRYNPVSGTKISEIKFPAQKITSCCWGGPQLDTLYVTSASLVLTEEQLAAQPTAGSVYTVTGLGVKGVKSEIFRE